MHKETKMYKHETICTVCGEYMPPGTPGDLTALGIKHAPECPGKCCHIPCGHQAAYTVTTDGTPDGYTLACAEHALVMIPPTGAYLTAR